MRILILSRKFEIYSTRRLVEEFSHAGHSVFLWDPGWPTEKLRGCFDVLIPRLGSFHFEEALESVEMLSSRCGVVVNTLEAYRKARNKWSSYIAFLEGKIPTPFSQLVSNGDAVLWSRAFPCIVKELESAKGEGVFLARSTDELLQIASRISPSSEYLVQEAFPESFGEDVRIFIVGGKIIASMKRKSTKDFRSNLAQGGIGEFCTITEAEAALALNAASILGLQIAGVDILRTHKGSLILEANPCPGLEGIEKYTSVNVAHAIIKFIEEHHHGHAP